MNSLILIKKKNINFDLHLVASPVEVANEFCGISWKPLILSVSYVMKSE